MLVPTLNSFETAGTAFAFQGALAYPLAAFPGFGVDYGPRAM